jgi:hypothetical protein
MTDCIMILTKLNDSPITISTLNCYIAMVFEVGLKQKNEVKKFLSKKSFKVLSLSGSE